MSCLSLEAIKQLCILIVVIIGLWSILQMMLPRLLQVLPDLVVQIIRIVLWMVIAIFCIIIIFGLLECLWGAGGSIFHFPAR